MKIQPENTTIVTGVAKSALALEKNSHTNLEILDFGVGKLRNSIYLVQKGYNVSILDIELQIKRIKETKDLSQFNRVFEIGQEVSDQFDIVLCSFVLNVIPELKDRVEALSRIYSLLKKEGIL